MNHLYAQQEKLATQFRCSRQKKMATKPICGQQQQVEADGKKIFTLQNDSAERLDDNTTQATPQVLDFAKKLLLRDADVAYGGVDEMDRLDCLNEPAVPHNLKKRYALHEICVAAYKKLKRNGFTDYIPKNAPRKVLRKEFVELALYTQHTVIHVYYLETLTKFHTSDLSCKGFLM
nr:myosin-15 isoform X2 [Tanacetum cinerariifolium]